MEFSGMGWVRELLLHAEGQIYELMMFPGKV